MSGRWIPGAPWRPRTPEELDAAALAECQAQAGMMGYGGAWCLSEKHRAAVRRQLETNDQDGLEGEPAEGWNRVWVEDPYPEDYRCFSKITSSKNGNVLRLTLYSTHHEPDDVRWVEQAGWNKGEVYT